MPNPPDRRQFLKLVTALSLVETPTRAPAAPSTLSEVGGPSTAFEYLTQPESAFLDAAVARLIPADELGAGAREAGVTHFIDRQLAGVWGAQGRNYRQGPWPEGTPQQGLQSPLTPAEIYRVAIAEINRSCEQQFGRVFAALIHEEQDMMLHQLQDGQLALNGVASAVFFDLLWSNTQEGFFADPLYGGNRDKVGWKLIGFPGVAAVYTNDMDRRNEPYIAVPVSIQDLEAGDIPVDHHGHPVHRLLTPKDEKQR